MSLSDRSKSILLQVAYKGVIEGGVGQAGSLKAAVLEQFNLLVDLHTELGLSPDDDKPRSGGGGRQTAAMELCRVSRHASGQGQRVPFVLLPSAGIAIR